MTELFNFNVTYHVVLWEHNYVVGTTNTVI